MYFFCKSKPKVYPCDLSEEIDNEWANYSDVHATSHSKETSYKFLMKTFCISSAQEEGFIIQKLGILMRIKQRSIYPGYIPSIKELPADSNVFLLHQKETIEKRCLKRLHQIIEISFNDRVEAGAYFYNKRGRVDSINTVDGMAVYELELLSILNSVQKKPL